MAIMAPFLMRVAESASAPVNGNSMPMVTALSCARAEVELSEMTHVAAASALNVPINSRREIVAIFCLHVHVLFETASRRLFLLLSASLPNVVGQDVGSPLPAIKKSGRLGYYAGASI